MPYSHAGFLLSAFLLIGAAPSHSAGLEDADQRLYLAQLAMAEKGDTRAQYYLGEMHEQGLGTRQDIEEAFRWYTRAADKGDALAMRKLAHREEILADYRKEQTKERRKTVESPAKPVNPDSVDKIPGDVASVAVEHPDPAQLEQERKQAEEKEKRRAVVRAILLEHKRNPAGELFE